MLYYYVMLLPHLFHGFDVAIQPQHVFGEGAVYQVESIESVKKLTCLSSKVILKPKAWHTYLHLYDSDT